MRLYTTYHVGNDHDDVAVYGFDEPTETRNGRLNHLGVLIDDLDATEARVVAAGLTPHTHGDDEPGRRFYFDDPDGVEFEVVSYTS